MIDLVIDYPVYLGDNSNLLTDASHPKTTHPLFPTLKLTVLRISGDISKQQAFLQQLSTCSPKALRPQPPRHITVPGLSGVAGVKNGRVIPYLLQSLKSERFWQNNSRREHNTGRSVISSAHVHVDSKPIGQHPPVVRMMRGVSICRPPQPRHQHTWNVAMMTEYLSRLGGNDNLSEKLCVLMALTCPERSSVLTSLNIKYSKYFPEGVKFQHTIFRKRSHNGNLGNQSFLGLRIRYSVQWRVFLPIWIERKNGERTRPTSCNRSYFCPLKSLINR